jgi:hypothetical protein
VDGAREQSGKKGVTMFPNGYGKVLLRWVQEKRGDLSVDAADTTVRRA